MDPWIGVDLDGTLVTYDGWQGVEHVGEPIELMCDRVREWLAEGKTVKIFTARVTKPENARNLFEIIKHNNIVRKSIDEFSMKEFGVELEITNIKDFGMIELWDDRAIQVVPNTGQLMIDEHYQDGWSDRGSYEH